MEEAREKLARKIPDGLSLLSETILSDGNPKRVRESADTAEEAHKKAQSKMPVDANLIEKKEVMKSSKSVIEVEAFDENGAMAETNLVISDTARVVNLTKIAEGEKGFLGIGKKPHGYQANIFQLSIVELVYGEEARIRAKIGEKPKM